MKYQMIALVAFEIETSNDDDDYDELEEKKAQAEKDLNRIGMSLSSIESEEPIG